jgi:drug/metabolite transporter (DMT)-like permease
MPRIPLVAVSGTMIALIVLPLSTPLQLSGDSYVVLIIMGMVQMPLALILITSGTRYLTSPEVSLFLLLETLFGPIWVWLVFGETVSLQTLAGGMIIVATLVVYSWRSFQIAKSG